MYVVGSTAIKQGLSNAGFKVIYDEVMLLTPFLKLLLIICNFKISPVDENVPNVIKRLSNLRPNVKAVYLDFGFNIDFMSLQKCISYIMKNQAIFLVGMLDPVVPFSEFHLIGLTTTTFNPIHHVAWMIFRCSKVRKNNRRNHRSQA